ncbi:sorting nexin-17 [Salvelinus namaycush]|uniref:Sorting nexin-17 n=1 Tax=Salvelinus namaycush TaxID=8040 RepID=A0A8U0P646_SALNM|nr:sorting nexin-17 [Salvelinus namaycush]
MHFSIPETEVRSGEHGSKYVAYNIHVNGVLHCRVRYSQLLGLHEQIKKEYGNNLVPAFPPKKIFTLTPTDVEQRRELLEKYMQAVRQDPMLGASEMFNSFLRKAQQETQQIPTEEVPLEIYLSNGQKVEVNILTSDQTEDVLEAVASKLDLPDELVGYFSLFLVREGVDGGLTCKHSQVPVVNGSSSPTPAPCSSAKCEVKLELAFEYLMSKDRLQWVTITSPQAIMMSICLQSMVDELMVKKSGGSIKKMLRKRHNGSLHRSESQQAVKSPPLLDSPDPNRDQIVKLSTKLSSVSLRGISASNSANDISGNDFHGNYAFEGIGDDDL